MRMRFRWRWYMNLLGYVWRWLVLGFFILSVYIVFNISSERTSADLEREITRLSVYYVRALARERGLHPYYDSVDVADLQKTMSVLLQTMLVRVSHLETVMKHNYTQIAYSEKRPNFASRDVRYRATPDAAPGATPLPGGLPADSTPYRTELKHFQDFLKYKLLQSGLKRSGGTCELPSNWRSEYPECEGKLEWMGRYYSSDPCYAKFGVDGTHCSALLYLAEVESFCPHSPSIQTRVAARPNSDLSKLTSLLVHANTAIRIRAQRSWPAWSQAALQLSKQTAGGNYGLQARVVLYPASGAASALQAMMWADLASSLHALGHTILWVHSADRLRQLVAAFPGLDEKSPCQAKLSILVDLIYTDDLGLQQLTRASSKIIPRIACSVRIVRETGIIPMLERQPDHLVWRQYLTAYPTWDDHGFLGFAMRSEKPAEQRRKRKNALILGSMPDVFSNSGPYLRAISGYFSLHTLLPTREYVSEVERLVSPYVTKFTNHEVPSFESPQFEALLRDSAVMIGLGQPLDPALAMLAIAHGVVFLNPRFDPPLVISNKTADWAVTSQHTYIERYVGEPWSFLVDTSKPEEVGRLLRRLKYSHSARPFVPFEFSHAGYLQRLTTFMRREDLCAASSSSLEPQWPPAEAIEFYLSVSGDSCERTCRKRGRKCEALYFPLINSRSELEERSIHCSSVLYRSTAIFPAYDPDSRACHFQSEPRRYSCFHPPAAAPGLLRICPCRDHLPGQRAVCKKCL